MPASENYANLLRDLLPGAHVDICYPADAAAALPEGQSLEGYDGVAITGSSLHLYDGGVPVQRQVDLSGEAEAIGNRNMHEPFRRFFTALRVRLAKTFGEGAKGSGFQPIDTEELIGELLAAEEALAQMQSVSLASTLVRPVRWEVETFGFRSVSLDIRQNTTVIS